MTLYEVCEFIAKNGGATIKHKGGGECEVVKRKRGYVVALYGYEKAFIFTSVERLHIMLLKYMRDNAEMLKNRYFLGAWINDGIAYLDITIIFKNKVNALIRASLEKQQAIYEFNTGKTLYLKDYDYLINSVILFEKVSNIRDYNLNDLNYFRGYTKQLNRCNAYVLCGRCKHIPVSVYYSYNTIIFIVIYDKLYFNRLLYSNTTTQHIHKFIKEYSLKYLEWYQLKRDAWRSLLNQLNLYTQFEFISDYYNNELNWLIDIEDITR